MNRLFLSMTLCAALILMSGCTDEQKIAKVKQTAIHNCGGKTMDALLDELLDTPAWGVEKSGDTTVVTVKGILAGGTLPAWVKEQKLMDITFRFPLDPKTGEYNPAALDGFPSLTTPEGVLQAYKALVCS